MPAYAGIIFLFKEKNMPFKSEICFKKDGEPLSSYLSEDDAVGGADYVRTNFGNDLVPYKCSKCGYWHLSPKERHTPSKTCICPDSGGKPKELYATREDAERRAGIIAKEKGRRLKVYPCPYQAGWHLTKNLSGF
jgi:hypothetical protein